MEENGRHNYLTNSEVIFDFLWLIVGISDKSGFRIPFAHCNTRSTSISRFCDHLKWSCHQTDIVSVSGQEISAFRNNLFQSRFESLKLNFLLVYSFAINAIACLRGIKNAPVFLPVWNRCSLLRCFDNQYLQKDLHHLVGKYL